MMGDVLTVVLGGSRNHNQLPDEVVERLQTWINEGVDFVVGDASGIDTVFQSVLKKYKDVQVRVFTSAPHVRSNLGDWPVVPVDSGLKSRGSAMHTAKDREMTRIADSGLLTWDGRSAGTLANVIDLADQGKDTYLYVAPERSLRHVENALGITELAHAYPEPFAEAQKRLRQFAKRNAKQHKPVGQSEKLFDEPESPHP